MSALNNILRSLTPPPVVVTDDYDGVEYRWKFLTFRPALFQYEIYLAGAVLFYVVFFLWGKYNNAGKVKAWFAAHLDIFNAQFASTTTELTADGNSDFYGYSTGRKNVASLHTVFSLNPRHDFLQWTFQTLRSLVELEYQPTDIVELEFTLGESKEDIPAFVWGIVRKDVMRKLPSARWDLTFTKTTENPALPPNFSVMSEFADITDCLLKQQGFAQLLKDPKYQPYLRSLTITDQPRKRPVTGPIPAAKRSKKLIATFDLPSGSAVNDTRDFVTGIFSLIDNLGKLNLRPDTRTKLRKTREEVDKQLAQDADRDAKEEREQAADDKKAAKRKLEEERIAKLPAAEQQKILERERKRSARKAQSKVVKR